MRLLITAVAGSMYTEPQVFETLNRLVRIYLESYPDDRQGLERFLNWAYSQYGYTSPFTDGEKNEEKTNSMRV